MSNQNLTNIQALEKYRVSFENVKNQEDIASAMTEIGYDDEVIAEGKELLQTTRATHDLNEQEDDETSQAKAHFDSIELDLVTKYKIHREKGKIVFRTDKETLDQLVLSGSQPQNYLERLEMIKKFYSVASSNPVIQKKFRRLRVTPKELADGNILVATLEQARADYLKEKGEDQATTKAKDEAFAKMDNYMMDFYAVAKIALADKPQLLEALGVFVRS